MAKGRRQAAEFAGFPRFPGIAGFQGFPRFPGNELTSGFAWRFQFQATGARFTACRTGPEAVTPDRAQHPPTGPHTPARTIRQPRDRLASTRCPDPEKAAEAGRTGAGLPVATVAGMR